MTWECKRNGNRKALPRERSQPQFCQGFPMVDGPNGPEIDMDLDKDLGEEDAGGNDDSGGDEAAGAEFSVGELDDSESEEEVPQKQKRHSTGHGQMKSKGKAKEKGEVEWKALGRKRRATNRDAVDLVVAFSKMSSQRHLESLPGFISEVCGPGRQSDSPTISPSANSSGLSLLPTMLSHVDSLISDAKILDFYRMIALMQLSLWLDW